MGRALLDRELWVTRAGASDVGRSILATAWIGIAILVGLAAGVALGTLLHAPRWGIVVGLAVTAAVGRLERALVRRLQPEPEKRRVRLDDDALVAEGLVSIPRRALHACRYDAEHETLWLRGALGWPLLAIEMPVTDAARVAGLLALPERGVRTFRAVSIPAGIPWIGFWLLWGSGCMSAFAIAMVLGGPPRVALVVALVVLPLATVLVPSRIHVGDTEITRAWMGVKQRVALIEVRDAAIEGHVLVLTTTRATHRWRLRFETRGHGPLAEWAYERWAAKADATNRAILALLHARAGSAIARVFE